MSLEEQQFVKWLRRPTIFTANAWYLLATSGQTLVVFLFSFLAQALSLFGVSVGNDVFSATANIFYEVGLLALPVVWYAATHEGVDQAMRLNPPKADMMLFAALAAFVGVFMANHLSVWWMLLIEGAGGTLYESSIPVPTTPDELRASILMVGVIPGVCEELFFRGGLMGAWERRGTKLALVITSVLFTMLHGSILGLPTQLIMGFVLGYVLIVSDSLYVSMVYHTVHNTATLILAYLSAQTAQAGMESARLVEQIAASGGFISLALQTIGSVLMFGAAITMIAAAGKRHGHEPEKIVEGDQTPMTWQELLVLLGGLITVGIAYLTDLLTVVGL